MPSASQRFSAPGLACRALSRAPGGAVAAPTRTAHPRLRWAAGSKTETPARQGGSRSPSAVPDTLPEETRQPATPTVSAARCRVVFDHLGREFREVVDWLSGEDLRLLRDSGVINSPHSGLIKKWTSRWTRNTSLQHSFPFLEPGDLGTVVAAFFVSDVALASAAHSASTAALRAGGRRRVPLAATDIITAV